MEALAINKLLAHEEMEARNEKKNQIKLRIVLYVFILMYVHKTTLKWISAAETYFILLPSNYLQITTHGLDRHVAGKNSNHDSEKCLSNVFRFASIGSGKTSGRKTNKRFRGTFFLFNHHT
jgi:hypothetical protein